MASGPALDLTTLFEVTCFRGPSETNYGPARHTAEAAIDKNRRGGGGAEGGSHTKGPDPPCLNVCRVGGRGAGLSLKGGRKEFVTPTETKVHGDALCFMVMTGARHKTTETVLANGWRLAAVGGWRLGAVLNKKK